MPADPNEFDLETIQVWPADAIARLRQAWITTADQLIALAAIADGVASIARATGLEPDRVRDLVAQTRRFLSAHRLGELETPIDTSDYGLGAEEPVPPAKKHR